MNNESYYVYAYVCIYLFKRLKSWFKSNVKVCHHVTPIRLKSGIHAGHNCHNMSSSRESLFICVIVREFHLLLINKCLESRDEHVIYVTVHVYIVNQLPGNGIVN
jgi:hypothetical protein